MQVSDRYGHNSKPASVQAARYNDSQNAKDVPKSKPAALPGKWSITDALKDISELSQRSKLSVYCSTVEELILHMIAKRPEKDHPILYMEGANALYRLDSTHANDVIKLKEMAASESSSYKKIFYAALDFIESLEPKWIDDFERLDQRTSDIGG
jgi:hypothetical protein